MHFAPAIRIAVLALGTAGVASAAETAAGAKASPFMPPAANAAPAGGGETNESLEFAGISSIGSRTDYILHDRGAKKSFWIAMGETRNGVTLVSHDERRNLLTISANGTQRQLPLRKAAAASGRPGAMPAAAQAALPSPAVVPTPAAPPPVQPGPTEPLPAVQPQTVTSQPATPGQEAIVRQETEARMLVSDLLEIGMAQRRAYEEAQRRTASGNQGDEGRKQP